MTQTQNVAPDANGEAQIGSYLSKSGESEYRLEKLAISTKSPEDIQITDLGVRLPSKSLCLFFAQNIKTLITN